MTTLSLKPDHLRRYKDLLHLLVKYGRSDLVHEAGLGAALEDGGEPVDEATVAKADELAKDLEALGPTYVKLGQLLSTRADLLPPAYLRALSRLQDDVDPFPYDEVREIVERELCVRVSDAFSWFEEEPMAAASLGQVHRAAMRDGRRVAVKVQRPDIRDRIVTDLASLEELATFLDDHTELGRRYGFAGMLDEFRRSMMAELDYRREAQNLRILGQNLASFDRIVVPQPIDDFTTNLVLTMDLVEGRKITSVGPLGRMDIDGCGLAADLFRAYLKQVLQDGFFHADPHPGNVYLTSDGRLALLDLGMVARVAPEMQERLVKLLLALSEADGQEVADVGIELGERRESFDEVAFRRDVANLVVSQQGLDLSEISAGTLVADLSRISGEHGLRPAPELTMLGKALLNLDEVARTLDPEFDPNAAIRDEAASIMRSQMLRSITPGSMFSAAREAKEFAEKLPARVNKVMDALAEGQLTLNVQGVDEAEIMKGIKKLANRITMGLVLAALIVGAAMMMRVPSTSTLFGYPAIAIVCFLTAAVFAFTLLGSIVLSDRKAARPDS